MPQLIKDRAVAVDRYALARTATAPADLPEAGPVIVPLALWLAHRDSLRARGNVGVLLAPADDPAALGDDVFRLPVIAVDFPQFTDGRGYSIGRLLRERHHFAGELRAVGDVGRDHLYYLSQCGFDAFELRDGRDAQAALASLADFSDGYQATQLRSPWFRRRAEAAPAAPGDVWFPCA